MSCSESIGYNYKYRENNYRIFSINNMYLQSKISNDIHGIKYYTIYWSKCYSDYLSN